MPRGQVLLEDLTAVIDVSIIVALVTAITCLRRRDISVTTLCHALFMLLLFAGCGHYIEEHCMGTDGVYELVHVHREGYGNNFRSINLTQHYIAQHLHY
jgi:hypothetical protein